MECGGFKPETAQGIIDSLNDAYQQGFHDASIELMNNKSEA